jgi:hypothetical protein
MDRDGDAGDMAARTCGNYRLERIDVAHLVTKDGHGAGVIASDQPLDGLALAACLARPEIDDRPAAVMGETVDEAEPSLDRLDRRHHGRARGRDVVRLANMERDRRSLPFDEEPGRRPEFSGDTACERFRRSAVDVERGVGGDDELFRASAAWQPCVLETVIAKVVDATDAHPSSDVRDYASGEYRDREALRARGGEAGKASKSALRERFDAGDGGIARADRERAVEVDHQQERRPGRDQRGHGSVDLAGGRDCGSGYRGGAIRRSGAGRRHGWMTAVLADGDTDGTTFGTADADALALGDDEAVALADADGVGLGDALGDGSSANDGAGWGARVGAASGTGARRRIPPRTSAAAAIPVSRPATIDSRGHMLARRVPVRTPRGASSEAPIRCGSDGPTDR